MSRASRLDMLRKLASLAERNQRRILGANVAKLNSARAQQNTLESYQQDYLQRWLQMASSGVSGNQLRLSSAFHEQLATTIRLQVLQVRRASDEADGAILGWQRARLREQSLERLYALECIRLARSAERIEQREIDDLINIHR